MKFIYALSLIYILGCGVKSSQKNNENPIETEEGYLELIKNNPYANRPASCKAEGQNIDFSEVQSILKGASNNEPVSCDGYLSTLQNYADSENPEKSLTSIGYTEFTHLTDKTKEFYNEGKSFKELITVTLSSLPGSIDFSTTNWCEFPGFEQSLNMIFTEANNQSLCPFYWPHGFYLFQSLNNVYIMNVEQKKALANLADVFWKNIKLHNESSRNDIEEKYLIKLRDHKFINLNPSDFEFADIMNNLKNIDSIPKALSSLKAQEECLSEKVDWFPKYLQQCKKEATILTRSLAYSQYYFNYSLSYDQYRAEKSCEENVQNFFNLALENESNKNLIIYSMKYLGVIGIPDNSGKVNSTPLKHVINYYSSMHKQNIVDMPLTVVSLGNSMETASGWFYPQMSQISINRNSSKKTIYHELTHVWDRCSSNPEKIKDWEKLGNVRNPQIQVEDSFREFMIKENYSHEFNKENILDNYGMASVSEDVATTVEWILENPNNDGSSLNPVNQNKIKFIYENILSKEALGKSVSFDQM